MSSAENPKHFKIRNFAAVTYTFLRRTRATSKKSRSFPVRNNWRHLVEHAIFLNNFRNKTKHHGKGISHDQQKEEKKNTDHAVKARAEI